MTIKIPKIELLRLVPKYKYYFLIPITGAVILTIAVAIYWHPPVHNSTPKPAPYTYSNSDHKFSFSFPSTSQIHSEEKTTSPHGNRLLLLVISDKSLSQQVRVKDDELYFNLEVWKQNSAYPNTICKTSGTTPKKETQKIQLANQTAETFTYTDKYKRFHQDICLHKDDKTYLFMSSVSTQYGNQKTVESFLRKITESFKFN